MGDLAQACSTLAVLSAQALGAMTSARRRWALQAPSLSDFRRASALRALEIARASCPPGPVAIAASLALGFVVRADEVGDDDDEEGEGEEEEQEE
mmetsp:Transcript_32359/g.69245  ORF Transcript_32359/g.69245 Transcript_32359/m.69245 type:complete len:95 (-) Transcript_32359:96-380(-)